MKIQTNYLLQAIGNRLALIIILICLSFSKTYSQPYVDFSGKWVVNSQKCNPVYNRQLTYIMTQEGTYITMETIIVSKATGKPFSVTEKYTLNGNVEDNDAFGIKTKITSAWSPDHKSFYFKTIEYKTVNGISKELTTVFTYKLTEDSKELIQTNVSDYLLENGNIEHKTVVLVFDKVEE